MKRETDRRQQPKGVHVFPSKVRSQPALLKNETSENKLNINSFKTKQNKTTLQPKQQHTKDRLFFKKEKKKKLRVKLESSNLPPNPFCQFLPLL